MKNKSKTINNTKQFIVNLIFSIISFVLNLFISFFITPYITRQFGSEAYGFVKLASDFTSYASLFSIALNSMSSRFIMIERVRGNFDRANKYFSSVFFANVVLSAFLAIPSLLVIILLDKWLSIPLALVYEVKLTFAITFASFLLNLIFSVHGNCYYLTNKLNVRYVCEAISNVLRVASIIFLFLLLTPRISYVVIGGLVAAVFSIVYNIVYTKRLTPDFHVSFRDFSWKMLWEIFSAGMWNSITKLSQIFSSGLDLMVTNLFIGPAEMGYLAVAKTVPNLIASFNSRVANIFSPNMMELYAKGDMNELKKSAKTAMRFMCLFVTIPNAILITMGQEFFSLWVPEQPSALISALSILTVINSCVTGPLAPLYQVFTITNKVKESSIVLIIYGFVSILVTFICLQFTSLGLFAVAGVSLIGSLIVALCYHLPFAAIYIGLPWYEFFPEVGKGVISLAVQCFVGWLVNVAFSVGESWLLWFLCASFAGIIGFALNCLIVLNGNEKKMLIDKLTVRKERRRDEKNSDC